MSALLLCECWFAVFVRAAVLPRDYVGLDWRQTHNKDCPLPHKTRRNRFLSASTLSVGLTMRIECQVIFSPWVKHVINSRISLNTSKQMPQTNFWSLPLPPHVGTQATGLENHRHWSHVIFAEESRVSLCNCNGRVRICHGVGEKLVDWCIRGTDGIHRALGWDQ